VFLYDVHVKENVQTVNANAITNEVGTLQDVKAVLASMSAKTVKVQVEELELA
jgi:hypothetical protein